MGLVKLHEVLVGRSLVERHLHHLIIYSLTAGSIKRSIITPHHALLRRTINTLEESISTLVGAYLLVGKLSVIDKLRPEHLRGVFLRVDIQEPAVFLMTFLQFLDVIIRG